MAHLDADVLRLSVFLHVLVRKNGVLHNLTKKIDNHAPHKRDGVLAHARLPAKVLNKAADVRSLAVEVKKIRHKQSEKSKKRIKCSQGGVVKGLTGAHVNRVFGDFRRDVETVGRVLDVIYVD